MNTNSDVYVLDSAKIDSITISQGVLIYKGKVENYTKDEVVIIITDIKGRAFIKSVPREKVFESYQKALEAIDAIIKESIQEKPISTLEEEIARTENKPQPEK